MSKLVTDHMENSGIEFLWHRVPQQLEKNKNGSLTMTWMDGDGVSGHLQCDTVMFAIGKDIIYKCMLVPCALAYCMSTTDQRCRYRYIKFSSFL